MTPHQVIGQGFIYMRTDQPPFNDVRVRRAVSLAIDRKAWNDALLFGEGCVDAGPVPCALKDWKLDAAKIDRRQGEVPRSATIPPRPRSCWRRPGRRGGSRRRCSTGRATWCRGAATTSWRPRTWADRHQRRAEARGVRQVHLDDRARQVREDGDGPARRRSPRWTTSSTGASSPSSPTNQSRVADAELSKMLIAQRREMDPTKRKADRGRHPALPGRQGVLRLRARSGRSTSRTRRTVKGFKHHDGYGLGMRLVYTWLDK